MFPVSSRSLRRLATMALAPCFAAAALCALTSDRTSSAQPMTNPDAKSFDAAVEVLLPTFDAKPKPLDGKPSDAAVDVLLDARLDTPKPIPPDPTPLACDSAFVLTLKWDKGLLTLERATRIKLDKKQALPRHLGRFAAELYVGPELLERMRFDVPLLSDDGVTATAYEKGLVTTVEVKVPESERPTRLEVWDRSNDKRWVFPYPPKLSP